MDILPDFKLTMRLRKHYLKTIVTFQKKELLTE